jgi:hypothetical protein
MQLNNLKKNFINNNMIELDERFSSNFNNKIPFISNVDIEIQIVFLL